MMLSNNGMKIMNRNHLQMVPALVSVAALTWACYGGVKCTDLSGIWYKAEGCLGYDMLHVSQDGCKLQFEEEPSWTVDVRGRNVVIMTDEGVECSGSVDYYPEESEQVISGTCRPDGCAWQYVRSLADGDCAAGMAIRESVKIYEPPGVDILLIVDNSGSMAAEQGMLNEAFPGLISALLDPPTEPDTGRRAFAPVSDLHIGVVSTDMGVGGYDVQTCDEPLGDDGILQHAAHGAECDASYPKFLSYETVAGQEPDQDKIDRLVHDFGCIAVLGTNGCGFEQQLEAAWKALMVHAQPGGANDGFLRPDTILVILFVTDEEDCSAADQDIFDVSSRPYSISLQCYYQKALLHPVSRYATDFRSLRSNPENIVLGFIIGVTPGEACEGRGDMISGCLDLPAMQEVIRPDGELLQYSCKFPPDCQPPDPPHAGNCSSEAFPARRYVELAQQFGSRSVVGSVCTDSFEPVIAELREAVAEPLSAVIAGLPISLEAGKDPMDSCKCSTACTLIEELTDDRSCESLDKPAKATHRDENGDPVMVVDDETGRRHSICAVQQADAVISDCSRDCNDPAASYTMNSGQEGWWYDPSIDVDGDTMPDSRIRFSPGAGPEPGSLLFIDCCFQE